jgi:hypothetical protein
MRKGRFSEEQIIGIIREYEAGVGEILMAAPSESTPPLPFRYYI